jgi:hypothetical protein
MWFASQDVTAVRKHQLASSACGSGQAPRRRCPKLAQIFGRDFPFAEPVSAQACHLPFY